MQQFTLSYRNESLNLFHKPFGMPEFASTPSLVRINFNFMSKKKPPATFPITGVNYRRLLNLVRALNQGRLCSEK